MSAIHRTGLGALLIVSAAAMAISGCDRRHDDHREAAVAPAVQEVTHTTVIVRDNDRHHDHDHPAPPPRDDRDHH
jgi:hypothetical protein